MKWKTLTRIFTILTFGSWTEIINKHSVFIIKLLSFRTKFYNMLKKIFRTVFKISPKFSEAITLIIVFVPFSAATIFMTLGVMLVLGFNMHILYNYIYLVLSASLIIMTFMLNVKAMTKSLKLRAKKYGIRSNFIYEI